MQRRKYLTVAGVSLGLAGCTGSESSGAEQASPTNSETPTQTPSPTESPTATSEPASFELVSFSIPEKAEIGESIKFEFTVQNTGEVAGEFETTISYTTSESDDWSTGSEAWTETIDAGEEFTFVSEEFTSHYMRSFTYRVDAFDEEATVQWVSKTLSYGDSYTNPEGVELTVLGERTEKSYTWTSSGYEYTETAADGMTWLFVTVRAENTSGEIAYAPSSYDWVVVAGNSQYEQTSNYRSESEQYEGGDIQPGVVREGEILYQVPNDYMQKDSAVVWSESYYDGDVAAYWES